MRILCYVSTIYIYNIQSQHEYRVHLFWHFWVNNVANSLLCTYDIWIHIPMHATCDPDTHVDYGVPSVGRIDSILGLLCEKALQNTLYSAKETYNFSILLTVATPDPFSGTLGPTMSRIWYYVNATYIQGVLQCVLQCWNMIPKYPTCNPNTHVEYPFSGAFGSTMSRTRNMHW